MISRGPRRLDLRDDAVPLDRHEELAERDPILPRAPPDRPRNGYLVSAEARASRSRFSEAAFRAGGRSRRGSRPGRHALLRRARCSFTSRSSSGVEMAEAAEEIGARRFPPAFLRKDARRPSGEERDDDRRPRRRRASGFRCLAASLAEMTRRSSGREARARARRASRSKLLEEESLWKGSPAHGSEASPAGGGKNEVLEHRARPPRPWGRVRFRGKPIPDSSSSTSTRGSSWALVARLERPRGSGRGRLFPVARPGGRGGARCRGRPRRSRPSRASARRDGLRHVDLEEPVRARPSFPSGSKRRRDGAVALGRGADARCVEGLERAARLGEDASPRPRALLVRLELGL